MSDDFNFDEELQALHDNLDNIPYVISTLTQAQALAIIMQKGLQDSDRDTRLAVLDVMVGDVTRKNWDFTPGSTKDLPLQMISFLLNILIEPDEDNWELTDYGRKFLKHAEARAKVRNSSQKSGDNETGAHQTNLPNM